MKYALIIVCLVFTVMAFGILAFLVQLEPCLQLIVIAPLVLGVLYVFGKWCLSTDYGGNFWNT